MAYPVPDQLSGQASQKLIGIRVSYNFLQPQETYNLVYSRKTRGATEKLHFIVQLYRPKILKPSKVSLVKMHDHMIHLHHVIEDARD